MSIIARNPIENIVKRIRRLPIIRSIYMMWRKGNVRFPRYMVNWVGYFEPRIADMLKERILRGPPTPRGAMYQSAPIKVAFRSIRDN